VAVKVSIVAFRVQGFKALIVKIESMRVAKWAVRVF
jgi:hypothetical protein